MVRAVPRGRRGETSRELPLAWVSLALYSVEESVTVMS